MPEERNDSDDVAIDDRTVVNLKEVEWKLLTRFDQ